MARTIREWSKCFSEGKFDDPSFETQVDAGWYDWFCKHSSLAKKTQKIGKILSGFKNETLLDNYRVWFKNNCPMCYSLYDDFRFEPLDET